MTASLESLESRFADIKALQAAIAMMEWDQQTYMPRGGSPARASHLGSLSRIAHEMFVSEEIGALLGRAKSEVDPDSEEGALVRVAQREYDLATKVPAELVSRKVQLAAEGHEVWLAARANNDFERFRPYLEQMFEIARQEATYLGYRDHIYDALFDQYEEGAKAADATRLFETLKAPLVDLVRQIAESQNDPDDSFLTGEWPESKQREFTEFLVKEIGFDMNRGRQDVAPHPFCTGWSVGDIRLTTRFKPYLASSIFASLHEAGHGMYEQGSPAAWDLKFPMLVGGVSLGVHESQSRLWENIVGRSRPFWKRHLPELARRFPEFSDVPLDTFYRAVNKVQPSLIRVEADEVTYNLHILVRFELECDLLTGGLKAKDLPAAWNAKYKEYLGIEPETDSDGCLQDVHWSSGLIGYFPTYSMGNLLSYQIWNALRKDLGDTDALIERGEFRPILGWLQDNIYRHGKRYQPQDLIERATGRRMEANDYLTGIRAKYAELYGL